MAYDPTIAFKNPDFDRSEWEVFIAHPGMPGSGSTFHYIGEEIETMDYTVNTESNERATIASRLPKVTNKDGGITFPAAFKLTKGQPAYDAILSAGLLGLVNEEFDCIFLYGNVGVKEEGSLVEDAPFAQKAKVKLTVTSLGGAGTEKITVTSEGRTSGDIERGYMKLEDNGSPNYDPDTRPDGVKLGFGEDEDFEIYSIGGLGIGEIEKETVGNALMDGEMWLGSRVLNRVVEIESEWASADKRALFVDFFQHNMRFDVELLFNDAHYYGSCVLHEAYAAEKHEGNLYSGSDIELALFFDDPHLYTQTVFRYQIGFDTSLGSLFYTRPDQYPKVMPPGLASGLRRFFSIAQDSREYAINNPSSTPNGIEASILASGEVVNPRITNSTTGLYLQFNLTMKPDDLLYINTQVGFIKATLNGVDVLRHLTLPSRMVQAVGGRNSIMFNPDQGADRAKCEISFRGKVLAV